MQQLRDLVSRAASLTDIGEAAPAAGRNTVVMEWFVVIPRDHKCPMFNGRCAQHLSVADHGLFIFDHLKGEVKEEIRFQPNGE